MGHVRLIASGETWEVKSIAVAKNMLGQGTGAALMRKALERAFSAGAARVVAAAATAGSGNPRFYQPLGFPMEGVERDVFRPGRGYPNAEAAGIEVRDPVWFSIDAPSH